MLDCLRLIGNLLVIGELLWYLDALNKIREKNKFNRSIGAQLDEIIFYAFNEIIFCTHEGHDLKIKKMKRLTKDSKYTYCVLLFQGDIMIF